MRTEENGLVCERLWFLLLGVAIPCYLAYRFVHSLAVSSYWCISFLYGVAASGDIGSSAFGLHISEHMLSSTAISLHHQNWVIMTSSVIDHSGNSCSRHSAVSIIWCRACYIPFDMVSAGDHCCFSMSKHIVPFVLIFGWNIRVVNFIYKVSSTSQYDHGDGGTI